VEILKRKPGIGSGEPLLGFGDALALLGWHAVASRVYAHAAATRPGAAAAQRRLGESLVACGRWRPAAESYRHCVRLDGPSSEDLGALVLTLWKSGQYRAALERLDEMRHLNPASGELVLLKAVLSKRLREPATALRTYRLASWFVGEPNAPRFVLAERLVGQAKWEAALSAWRAASQIRQSRSPHSGRSVELPTPRAKPSELVMLRAGLLMRIGRRQSALRTLRAAAAGSRRPPSRRFRLGEGLLGVSCWQAACAAHATLAAVTLQRGRRAPARAAKGDLAMPAAPTAARSARRPAAPPSGRAARLALAAASLCVLVFAGALVATVRGRVTAASALDSPAARRLADRCTTLSGGPGIDACERALAMKLSPVRALLVREALARKRAQPGSAPTPPGVAAVLQ
jgi:tetratricopeptide (TPR) repeat protein